MLVQFTVENFLSIRDKVYLSLEPSKDSEHPENLITKGDYKAVNSVAIYGANASGKSSLFKAITVALIMIRNSNNVQVTDKLPMTPFKFDFESRNKPTSFEFTFIAKDGRKYIYGFSATTEKVVEEYLYCYNTSKPTLLFDLNENEKPKFNRAYKVKLEAAYQMNTANKLFLATATTWNVECTKSPFEWLAESIDTFTDVMELGGVAFEKYRTDENRKYIEFTKNLLKQADINISSIEVDAKEVMGGPALPFQIVVQGKIIPPNEGKHYDVEITTGYTVVDENGEKTEFSLTLQEESIGTQLLFFYGSLLKDAFEKGKTIVLDEIDKSMHPSLVKFIMNLFRDPDVNKNGAQLIVTTHETGILSLEMFRRDQIYFTEKDSKSGVTDLYSLDEFSVRKTENIEKGYLMGRYGAIPFLQAGEVL
ncbi:MAG: ATP-binding protein [Lachnospiraceae bacterium]|nr:MAG: ATP-binding protein [Lachnospiraceae bacterium]